MSDGSLLQQERVVQLFGPYLPNPPLPSPNLVGVINSVSISLPQDRSGSIAILAF